MRPLAGRAMLLVLLLLGCGCPQTNANPRPKDPVTRPVDPTPDDPHVVPADPNVGPAGPSRPSDRIPSPADGRPQTEFLRSRTLILGTARLQVWLADQRRSRTLGLMHVRDLPKDRGMLFIYPGVRRRAFWMQNTYVALSLAYIRSDGTIEQILDMQPLSEVSHPSKTAVRFVLEVNLGWFDRHKIEVGTRIEGIAGRRGF